MKVPLTRERETRRNSSPRASLSRSARLSEERRKEGGLGRRERAADTAESARSRRTSAAVGAVTLQPLPLAHRMARRGIAWHGIALRRESRGKRSRASSPLASSCSMIYEDPDNVMALALVLAEREEASDWRTRRRQDRQHARRTDSERIGKECSPSSLVPRPPSPVLKYSRYGSEHGCCCCLLLQRGSQAQARGGGGGREGRRLSVERERQASARC